jgi:hypothetical protein
MTQLFSASAGHVTFKGRPLCPFTVKRVRAEIIRNALNVEHKSRAFDVWMDAADQLIAAQESASEQRSIAA